MTFAFPKPMPRAKERRLRRLNTKANLALVRQQVMDRANGRCEVCGARGALELDHWLGGSGRRAQKQHRTTCWALCHICHQHRTENIPSAAHWNDVRRHFCERWGYAFQPHLEKPIGPRRVLLPPPPAPAPSRPTARDLAKAYVLLSPGDWRRKAARQELLLALQQEGPDAP